MCSAGQVCEGGKREKEKKEGRERKRCRKKEKKGEGRRGKGREGGRKETKRQGRRLSIHAAVNVPWEVKNSDSAPGSDTELLGYLGTVSPRSYPQDLFISRLVGLGLLQKILLLYYSRILKSSRPTIGNGGNKHSCIFVEDTEVYQTHSQRRSVIYFRQVALTKYPKFGIGLPLLGSYHPYTSAMLLPNPLDSNDLF